MENSSTLSPEEKRVLEALRQNPQLLDCFFELAEISENKIDDLQFGDDAEEATVKAIQKTGQATLKGWAKKKEVQAKEEWATKKDYRKHEKKSSLANFIGNDRD